MTILLDSTFGFQAPATFGLGLIDEPAPAKPRRQTGPTKADEVYWLAYNLGYEDEDPRCPTGLTMEERDAWVKGFADGRTMGDVDRIRDYAEHRARQDALEAAGCGDVPAWAVGLYDMPRA